MIDLNKATVEELTNLPGVAEGLAKRIVEFRDENGPFESADDLSKVQGISSRMAKEVEALISINPVEVATKVVSAASEGVENVSNAVGESAESFNERFEKMTSEKISDQLNALGQEIDRLAEQIPGIKDSEYAPTKLFVQIQENVDKFTPAILLNLREELLSASLKDLGAADIYKSMWDKITAAFDEGTTEIRQQVQDRVNPAIESANERFVNPLIDSARERLVDAPTLRERREEFEDRPVVKRTIDFVNGINLVQQTIEYAGKLPGATVLNTLTETIETTQPQKFFDGETWETLGSDLEKAYQSEVEKVREMLPFVGAAVEAEDEVIEVVEAAA